MKVRGLSLIGHVGRSESGGVLVAHAAHINLADGTRKTFPFSGDLPAHATKERIARAFGEAARLSLLEALSKNA
ncbi:MAG: hypothetical protein ACRBN8_22520 [Nannocystales bacterium]